MICGFCSREQSWAQKPCVACGGDVTGAIHSTFWEGGEGIQIERRERRGRKIEREERSGKHRKRRGHEY